MRLGRARSAITLLSLTALACGDGDGIERCTGRGDPDALGGSYCEGNEIAFDAIALGWSSGAEFFRVRYGLQEGDRVSPRLEVSVLSGIAQGTPVPLRERGSVRRWPEGVREPQDLTRSLSPSSELLLEQFRPEIGSEARGRFQILLDTGRTLQGTFFGPLESLDIPGG